MKNIDYETRTKCVVSGDENLELLSSEKYPLFCGCTEEVQSEDIIADMNFCISKNSGVIQLQKLIPLNLLYANGHDAGSVGAIWQEHHKQFARFVMQYKPKKILEIGGGHGKLALECLKLDENLNYTILEPNSNYKHEKISYIDAFFSKDLVADKNFDTIVHSHTFEHIYNPHEFLEELSSTLTGGGI
ncbi:class I SAM-dependent methyltransferase [Campylobacter sp. MIT 97-5078]|uniref:class I SAM-dependent methyltransferase n=1 Tax=Campylobacter sp. MIT 97-5078 TaxID=1548153 RepID=UPI000A57ADC9|nr:methyltransferase domain-containing protein [Campylobacter sp. MIT 97-5078]